MGILTNTKRRGEVLMKLVQYRNKISILLYVAGILGFLAIADEKMNDATYFSENALLPGLVDSQYFTAADAEDTIKAIKAAVKPEFANASDVLHNIVSSRLIAAGLEVYEHDYTFRYPFNFMQKKVVKGRNVYGIVRGPRTASTESIVLAVPLRPAAAGTGRPPTDAAVGLALSLAKHFRRYTYWAKDVVFLFTDHEHFGMQAWLDAYHGSKSSEFLEAGILPAHSGSIQAAINLELPSNTVSYINVKIEGINGQLPNLDLVNVVTRLCGKESVKPRLHHQPDRWSHDGLQNLMHNAKTMLLMMMQQATCMASGNHGLFHRYGIQAVTLEGVKTKGGRHVDLFSVGRVVEGVFRSLNNLQERFHQSFFFYLLPSTSRYASIGVYMIPFGLLAGGLLVQAIALWLKFGNALLERDEQRSKDAAAAAAAAAAASASSDGSDEPADAPAIDGKPDGGGARKDAATRFFDAAGNFTPSAAKMLLLPETISQGLGRLLPLVLTSHLLGFAVYSAPSFFGSISERTALEPEVCVLGGLAALLLASLLMPQSLPRNAEEDVNWELLKSLALLEHGAVLLAVSLVNVSLAAIVAVVTVPVYSALSPSSSKLATIFKGALALVASAPILGVAAQVVHLSVAADEGGDLATAVAAVLSHVDASVLQTLIDCSLVGSWLFTLVSLALFPSWLMFWSLLWLQE